MNFDKIALNLIAVFLIVVFISIAPAWVPDYAIALLAGIALIGSTYLFAK